MPDTCQSCGREIIWAKSPTGARLPLTARPVTVYALRGGDAIKATGFALGDYTQGEGPVYISHFVDCPGASEHSARPRERR